MRIIPRTAILLCILTVYIVVVVIVIAVDLGTSVNAIDVHRCNLCTRCALKRFGRRRSVKTP